MNKYIKRVLFFTIPLSLLVLNGWRNGRSLEISSQSSTDRDLFGQLFHIEDNLMVVGAGRDGERAPGGGAIHFFEQTDNKWQESFKLFPAVSVPFQYFGLSLASSDELLATTGCIDRGIYEAGVVFIYQLINEQWQEIQQIQTPSCTNRNSVLAMQGDRLAVGLLSSRQVIVYRWEKDQFIEEATLAPKETLIYSITDQYAQLKMVQMAGDRIVMSLEDGAGVYVFKVEDSVWQEEHKLTVLESSFSYGAAIAIDKNRIVVGDPGGWACQGPDCVIGGTAYLFEYQEEWQEIAKLQAERPFPDSWFGNSVQIVGDTAVIGAPLEIAGSFGAAYQFERCDGQWKQQARLFAGLNPRVEYALSRGWKSLSENVRSKELKVRQMVTAVQGGYQHPLQIGIGPAININDTHIYVGPTRENINNTRIIYQFGRDRCFS